MVIKMRNHLAAELIADHPPVHIVVALKDCLDIDKRQHDFLCLQGSYLFCTGK